jgi:hypothetical protein
VLLASSLLASGCATTMSAVVEGILYQGCILLTSESPSKRKKKRTSNDLQRAFLSDN